MSKVETFLTKIEEEEIVSAIKAAETNTSGEIRVHIEASSEKEHYKRALEVFYLLKMEETKDRNGVLLYVAVTDKKFVIYGDEGIHNKVAEGFWDATKNTIQNHFKKGNFKQGIIDGILNAGEELKVHFPLQIDDENELSNKVSKG